MKDRAEINRQNAQRSTGPKTEDGKRRSSRNAFKHGLTAKFTLPSNERQRDFQEFLDAYLDRFRPADAVEAELVHTIAVSRWRLRRIANLESNFIEIERSRSQQALAQEFPASTPDLEFALLFQRLAENASGLALLLRYESSLTRTHDRALKQLELLQKSRNEATEPEPPKRDIPPDSWVFLEVRDGKVVPNPSSPPPFCTDTDASVEDNTPEGTTVIAEPRE